MISTKVKRIIDTLVKTWDYDCVNPLEEDEIDWIFSESLSEEDIELSNQRFKEGIKLLTESLVKAFGRIKEQREKKKKITPVLKEDIINLSTVTSANLGKEIIEYEVDVDKINATLDNLIKTYGEDFTINIVEQGMAVESEHSKNEDIQFAIAIDHLSEDPKYYDKLSSIEGSDKENVDNPDSCEPVGEEETTEEPPIQEPVPEEEIEEPEGEESATDSQTGLDTEGKDTDRGVLPIFSDDYGEGEDNNELPDEDGFSIETEEPEEEEDDEAPEEETEEEKEEDVKKQESYKRERVKNRVLLRSLTEKMISVL